MPRKKSPSRFAKEIGWRPSRLHRLCDRRNNFYREKEIEKTHDDGSTQLDSNGESITRTITACYGPLRGIHVCIKRRYLNGVRHGEHVHGSIRGRDIRSNARAHLGLKHHFFTDIAGFFPSISRKRIFYVFYDHFRFTPEAAELGADLTCYKGVLPQGTVTSPALANLAFREVDDDILSVCSKCGIVYTRYVDDLVFSCGEDFSDQIELIIAAIRRNGFQISRKAKTRYKIGRATITGVVVRNNTTRAREETYAKLEAADPDSASYRGINSHVVYVNGMGKNG